MSAVNEMAGEIRDAGKDTGYRYRETLSQIEGGYTRRRLTWHVDTPHKIRETITSDRAYLTEEPSAMMTRHTRNPAEYTSAEIASIASRGLRVPSSLTLSEIKAVCASALGQARPKFRIWPWGRRERV